MSKIFVTSDTHFGHDRGFLYEPRGFENIQEHDVLMLKHEHLEFAIMKKIGYNYDEAHDLTNTKYDYSLAERYWREKNVDA